jgi:hypothetical protein
MSLFLEGMLILVKPCKPGCKLCASSSKAIMWLWLMNQKILITKDIVVDNNEFTCNMALDETKNRNLFE